MHLHKRFCSIVTIHLENSVFNHSLFGRCIHTDIAELFIIHLRFVLFFLIAEGISQPVFVEGDCEGDKRHIPLVCCEMHQLWFNLGIRSLRKAKPFPSGAVVLKGIKTCCETLMKQHSCGQRPIVRALPEQ